MHMAQLMPLPLTVSCFSKIQMGFAFLVLAHLGSPGKRAVKQVCVCVPCLKNGPCCRCTHTHTPAAVVECHCCGFRRYCSILWRCLIHRLCRICIVKRTYALRFYNRLSAPARKSVSSSRACCIRTCSDCPLPHCPPLPYRADKSTPALSNLAASCR